MPASNLPIGLEDELLDAADKAFASTPKPRRKDANGLAETIRISVRRAADQIWGKKPIVKVTVVQL
jgi:ribonuclease J